jgi:hypothetical protein
MPQLRERKINVTNATPKAAVACSLGKDYPVSLEIS